MGLRLQQKSLTLNDIQRQFTSGLMKNGSVQRGEETNIHVQQVSKYIITNCYYYNICKAHKFKQARDARWGTWIAGKEKEASFETAFKKPMDGIA